MIAGHAFLSKSALRVSALTKLLSIKNLKNWQDQKPAPKQANSINISTISTWHGIYVHNYSKHFPQWKHTLFDHYYKLLSYLTITHNVGRKFLRKK